jgi:hypothetical protein
MFSAFPSKPDIAQWGRHVRFVLPIGDIPMVFNRIASLRGEQDQRELIHAKNLPRNSPASCLRGIADDLRRRMRQNKKTPLSRVGPIAGEPAD